MKRMGLIFFIWIVALQYSLAGELVLRADQAHGNAHVASVEVMPPQAIVKPVEVAPSGPQVEYLFTQCKKPEPPVALSQTASTKKALSRSSYNKAVRQYNNHIAALNEYMICLSNEADTDLQTYYKVVSAALETEQDAQLKLAEELRSAFSSR